nr:hypothetical protein BgiMline_003796 [Biomphalaria glabrata]
MSCQQSMSATTSCHVSSQCQQPRHVMSAVNVSNHVMSCQQSMSAITSYHVSSQCQQPRHVMSAVNVMLAVKVKLAVNISDNPSPKH